MPRLQWEWMLESFVQVLAQVELSQIPSNRYVERFFNEFYSGAAMLIRRLRESASLLTTANPSTRALAIDMIHAWIFSNGINDSGEISRTCAILWLGSY